MNRIPVLALIVSGCLMCVLARGQTSPVGKLVFEDSFADMSNWVPEGPHKVQASGGRLHVKTDTADGQIGQYIWCRRELDLVGFALTAMHAGGNCNANH